MITQEKAQLIRGAIRALYIDGNPDHLPPNPHGVGVCLDLIDDCLVGTYHYMGRVQFWHEDFDHYFKKAPINERVVVHKALLRSCLDPTGNSYEHTMAIAGAVNSYRARIVRRKGRTRSPRHE